MQMHMPGMQMHIPLGTAMQIQLVTDQTKRKLANITICSHQNDVIVSEHAI